MKTDLMARPVVAWLDLNKVDLRSLYVDYAVSPTCATPMLTAEAAATATDCF